MSERKKWAVGADEERTIQKQCKLDGTQINTGLRKKKGVKDDSQLSGLRSWAEDGDIPWNKR